MKLHLPVMIILQVFMLVALGIGCINGKNIGVVLCVSLGFICSFLFYKMILDKLSEIVQKLSKRSQ